MTAVSVPTAAETTAVEQAAAEWAEAAVFARSGECADRKCPCEFEPWEPTDPNDPPYHSCQKCSACECAVLDRYDEARRAFFDAVVRAGLAGDIVECAESLTGAVR